MAILYKDLIEGNEATLSSDGWQFTRTAIVDGVVGVTGYAKLFYATNLMISEGAYIGAPHPAWPSATLRQINPIAIDNDTVKFSLIYRDNPTTRITGTSSLSQEQTNIDSDGDPIELTYTYPADYKDPNTGAASSLAGKEVKQGGTVMKYIPEISFSYTRSENEISHGSNGMSLIARQGQYVGKVNKDSWILGGFVQFPGTWMCTGITFDSQDNGLNYDVTYSFAKRRLDIGLEPLNVGWKTRIVFVRVDGNPAPDAVDGTSQKTIQIYESENFTPLGIV